MLKEAPGGQAQVTLSVTLSRLGLIADSVGLNVPTMGLEDAVETVKSRVLKEIGK